ncbi:MAG TPA: SpoIIE family protein phosphatase [Pyrinomonadaceae bacterium]
MIALSTTPQAIPHLPRTLIADDEPDILIALRLLLKSEGYQAEMVSSPAAVLEAITRSQFDVVLMDLNYARDTTSGREGLDLISRIQALDPLLPIIVMTAWANVDLAVEAMRRGVRDFVQKPWDNPRLLQTLHKQVKHARARRSARLRLVDDQRIDLVLKRELSEARELQENLLSKTMPELEGFKIAATWQPATTVGGDYVASFKISDQHAALCVADVVGKGLPAALLMSNFQAALKSSAFEDLAPSGVCDRVNRVLRPNMPLHKFVTGFYGVLDITERTLAFTNAGHNPPLLVRRNGECIRLDAGGSVLGVFDDVAYTESKLQLHSGDKLLLFTDGLSEAMDENGEQFGEDRLIRLMRTQLNADELQELIFATVSEFCANKFEDDAALMVVVVE